MTVKKKRPGRADRKGGPPAKPVDQLVDWSQAKSSAIINISPVPLAMNDDRQNITFLNPAFVQTFGYTREDIPTLSDWWPRAYPDPKYRKWVAETWLKEIDRARRSGSVFSPLEVKLTCKDGTVKTVLASAAPFSTELMGEHLVALYDITERKQAEAARHESEQLALEMAESFPSMLAYWTCDLRCRFANRAYTRWFGRTAEQIRGIHIRDLLGEQSFSEVEPDVRRVLKGENQQFERQLPGPDGTIHHLLVAYNKHECNGRVMGFFAHATDITSVKQAAEEKKRLEAELHRAQKLESIGRLAGGIAHDFNNMLTVILGHTEMAVNRPDLTEPLRTAMLEIHKAASRSSELTQQLLAFARKKTVAPKVVNLNQTISGMLQILQRLVGDQIELVWQPAGHLWQMMLDPSQVDQIVVNLCLNARDAIAGTGTITIRTENRSREQIAGASRAKNSREQFVLISVTDTGTGMDAQTQSRLFEPFFTTKEFGKGTGLGLASVYGAVTQNGGFIEVSSEVGLGTTFNIYLPRHSSRLAHTRR